MEKALAFDALSQLESPLSHLWRGFAARSRYETCRAPNFLGPTPKISSRSSSFNASY
jgi:hypothetical protein